MDSGTIDSEHVHHRGMMRGGGRGRAVRIRKSNLELTETMKKVHLSSHFPSVQRSSLLPERDRERAGRPFVSLYVTGLADDLKECSYYERKNGAVRFPRPDPSNFYHCTVGSPCTSNIPWLSAVYSEFSYVVLFGGAGH